MRFPSSFLWSSTAAAWEHWACREICLLLHGLPVWHSPGCMRCRVNPKREYQSVFHILGSVDQQRGCCEVADGKYEITLYTSCCNATKGIYYYTTYENHQITAVDMHRENLDGETLVHYPIVTGEHILWQN